jgi:Holliday junction resolvasome RuvABC endonuclease subunit
LSTKTFDGGLTRKEDVYIGIDQSLTGFGLTALSEDNPLEFYTWVYKSPYFGIERLVDIKEWIGDTLDYVQELGAEILDVAIEGSVLQSPAALKLGELAAIVKLELYERDKIFPLQVSPMTLKKFAAGKGNAKKQEMLMQMYKRWNVEFTDDNAADSYALARLVSGNGTGVIEKAVITQMSDPKYRDEKRLD